MGRSTRFSALGRSFLFDVNLRRHPQCPARVHAPTVEMKVAFGARALGSGCLHIGPVETHDRIVTILHPHPAHEFPGLLAVHRGYVEHQTADFAQKLPPDIFKAIGLAIEILQIDHRHLRKSTRQKSKRPVLRGIRTKRQPGTGLWRGAVGSLHQRFVSDGFAQAEAAQKIMILRGTRGGVGVFRHFLDIGFNQRRARLDSSQKNSLALHDAVEQFFN